MKTKLPVDGLVGLFFHSIANDGGIEWQGQIVSRPEPNNYIVQLFSWWSGDPTNCRLINIEQMKDWLFYQDNESLIHSYEYGTARSLNQKAGRASA